jgi:lipooligosaccharide transport system permease protein
MTVDVETPGMDRARGFRTPPSLRALSYWAYSYKRTWRGSVATSFLIPILYLAAMGVGLGSLVDKHTHTIDGVKYLYFLAPGLLASTAMQIGANESMYPIMGAIKWIRTYFAMLATPLSVTDVLLGTITWIAVRLTIVSSIYLAVIAAFGVAQSPLTLLALPAAVLTGLAFSTPIAAFSATCTNDTYFSAIYRFGVIPLFLFSGTFFPITQLPAWLRPIAYVTPLYHGVVLCRELVLGRVDWALVPVHAGYLLVLAVAGYLIARRTFRRRLIT